MQYELSSAPATARRVTMKFLGLSLPADGRSRMPAAGVRLHFATQLAPAEGPEAAGQDEVSGLCIGGLAPDRLHSVHVRDGTGDGVSLDSFDGHTGRPVTAGDMLLAMSRMAGLEGLTLDLRGIGLRWAHLAVELHVDCFGVQADAIEVVAAVRPIGPSVQPAARDADLPGNGAQAARPEAASRGI